MPTRTLSRRALRDQNDAAERAEPEQDIDDREDGSDEEAPKPRPRKKKPTTAKAPTKPRTRKKVAKEPQRMFARWAVFDSGLKRVAVFEYKDRAGADAKLAEIRERKAGTFFILLVKDPYDPPAEPATPAATA